MQPAILTLSYFGGLYFGLAAFFWLGAIRLVFSLHAQCFVNSVCHTEPNTPLGEDSQPQCELARRDALFSGRELAS